MERRWLFSGHRGRLEKVLTFSADLHWRVLLVVFAGALLCIVLWSFAWRWRFPSLLPVEFSFRSWEKALPHLTDPLMNSFFIGLLSSVASMIIVVTLLEHVRLLPEKWERWVARMMYLPLLLPQISLLFGIQIVFILLSVKVPYIAVVMVHILFVVPYCYLGLAGPWKHFDNRVMLQAWLLCGSTFKSFWQVKIPMLWPPLMASFALGFAVSVAQFLPTLLLGGGRIETITTEAVGLASGGDRRLTGVYSLLQVLIPLVMYGLAMFLVRWSVLKKRKRKLE